MAIKFKSVFFFVTFVILRLFFPFFNSANIRNNKLQIHLAKLLLSNKIQYGKLKHLVQMEIIQFSTGCITPYLWTLKNSVLTPSSTRSLIYTLLPIPNTSLSCSVNKQSCHPRHIVSAFTSSPAGQQIPIHFKKLFLNPPKMENIE